MRRARTIAADGRTIQFIDRQKPSLTAGRYTLEAQQVIETSPQKTYAAKRPMLVQAARFRLEESEVQSYFPPVGAPGQFQNDLPQLVLFDSTLPWQRALPGGGANTPWMALVLLERGEIASGSNSVTGSASTKLSQVLRPEAGTYGPQNLTLEEGQGENDVCQTIDITPATFKKVVPYLEELDYLAHCRNVDLRQKANAIAVSDGLFSLVIGNRFPKAASAGRKLDYVAHLVSLEGFAPCLNASFQFGSDVKKVRMVSLIGWNFSCEAGANFGELMSTLVAKAQSASDLLLRIPAPSGEGASADIVRRAYSRGYSAHGYDTRSGESTLAWYRGPFTPERVKSFGAKYEGGSAAAIYDETTGTFDHSYSAAWQMGRFLALSDTAYSAAKVTLRTRVRREVNLLRERSGAPSVREAFFHWLGEGFASILDNTISELPQNRIILAAHATAAESSYVEFEKLIDGGSLSAKVSVICTRELRSDAGEPVVRGDAALRLFYNMPFDLLVADARMLPADSIRFFYVDPNYIDALLAGAHSVGVDCTRTMREEAMMRDALMQASDDAACEHRAKLIGYDSETAASGTPVAGFLLRSALVSGWPGLEIAADRKTASGTEPVKPLRIDALAQTDMLLALYPVAPDRISFTEPRESLTFGTDEEMKVNLRYVSGENAGKVTGATAKVDKFRAGDARVVDVAQLQDAFRKVLGVTEWGPAAFALQMIRAPRRMWFYNPQLAPPPVQKVVAGMETVAEESEHV
jgi:hypothetical protein